ncbi:ClpP/crotonase [Polychaeton citri CBS 116435]|uniref:ClpP/crotonase n=1 Tax=Polychaeton citri CBS 116435 TaxID=1314669 RepID=A0A9P4UMP4_9PEZI|nr:ClpP/crotonase [Polychaeton citri CBS 116435]
MPGNPDIQPIILPETYDHNLPTSPPFSQIQLSHHPCSSPTTTATIILTLHRPKAHNAFTKTMMLEIERAFTILDLDSRVKCIVVTGSPPTSAGPPSKIFCAGADLSNRFVEDGEEPSTHRDGGGRVTLAIHRCRKPVIAAIQGAAVGVGATMTLPMSIRVAWREAKVGFVFARRGLVMEAASSYFLPRLVGMSKAIHLVTTGSVYPASHPLLSDLFTELLPTPDAVLPRALELADEIAQNNSTVAMALMKDMMYRGPDSAEAAHLLDSNLICDMFRSEDHREGVESFLQKRAANFTGTMEKNAPAAWPWWAPVDTGNRPVGVASGDTAKAKL